MQLAEGEQVEPQVMTELGGQVAQVPWEVVVPEYRSCIYLNLC